ncbi:hypothetical protein I6N98_17905 [Spongiibacter nanhainus]|uniref:Uncharacterized protein n=1 Tax=Spongiibacter nanhainus TaxID=2794344 RepID=A0A7T4UQH4_9GAMM|nr:hypothetical protein [Spongiibacter nanhainus]QQD18188.1 hypothetical protein I6N98_17905 [Spongiibacter nanhainus]
MKALSKPAKYLAFSAMMAFSVSASAADGPLAGVDALLTDLLGIQGLSNTLALLPLDAAGAQSAFELTGALLNPQTLFELGSGIGLPLVQNLLPPVQVLTTNPAELATFLTDGGSLLTSTIVLLPEIPLISAPLPGL